MAPANGSRKSFSTENKYFKYHSETFFFAILWSTFTDITAIFGYFYHFNFKKQWTVVSRFLRENLFKKWKISNPSRLEMKKRRNKNCWVGKLPYAFRFTILLGLKPWYWYLLKKCVSNCCWQTASTMTLCRKIIGKNIICNTIFPTSVTKEPSRSRCNVVGVRNHQKLVDKPVFFT